MKYIFILISSLFASYSHASAPQETRATIDLFVPPQGNHVEIGKTKPGLTLTELKDVDFFRFREGIPRVHIHLTDEDSAKLQELTIDKAGQDLTVLINGGEAFPPITLRIIETLTGGTVSWAVSDKDLDNYLNFLRTEFTPKPGD